MNQNLGPGAGWQDVVDQEGGSVSIVFPYSPITNSSLPVWRHIATGQSFSVYGEEAIDVEQRKDKYWLLLTGYLAICCDCVRVVVYVVSL